MGAIRAETSEQTLTDHCVMMIHPDNCQSKARVYNIIFQSRQEWEVNEKKMRSLLAKISREKVETSAKIMIISNNFCIFGYILIVFLANLKPII